MLGIGASLGVSSSSLVLAQIEKSPFLWEVKESREFLLFILIVPWGWGFIHVLQMISFSLSEVSPQRNK